MASATAESQMAMEARVDDAFHAVLDELAPRDLAPARNLAQEAYRDGYSAASQTLAAQKEAVRVIARAWQQFSDIRIYRYYRDLIKFRERGDPGLMLKCINPTEASLVDAAAGVHVRFRLGGDQFPPVIYYKIFIHNSLVDVNSFAPRDYTVHKQKDAKQVNNNKSKPKDDNHSGWYERVENNGWRPVADRTLAMFDQITQETSCRIIPFHHNKKARRRNKQQWAKMRKREWLQKMYASGKEAEALKAAPSSPSEEFPVDLDFEEEEAAILVQWSDGLDFEKYTEGWSKLATSARSELFSGISDFPLEALDQMYLSGTEEDLEE